jgi:hypothetical protein
MKRRHFLIGAAATAANLLTPDTSRSQSDIGPHLAVSYEDPGQAIALDFIGLSYESAILAGADYFTPNNASSRRGQISLRSPTPRLPRSSVCSMQDLVNPSASVHPKRFSTPSLTLKVLCAGNLNRRLLTSVCPSIYQFTPLHDAHRDHRQQLNLD